MTSSLGPHVSSAIFRMKSVCIPAPAPCAISKIFGALEGPLWMMLDAMMIAQGN